MRIAMVPSSWRYWPSLILGVLSAASLDVEKHHACESIGEDCEAMSVLQNYVRQSSTLNSAPGGEEEDQKARALEFSDDVGAGPEPRYDPLDPKRLLWSGDDVGTGSATTIVPFELLETTEDGDYVRVAETAPGCASECEQEPGCAGMNRNPGRLGNRLSSLYQTWYMLNASTWAKGAAIGANYMPYIFEFPDYICLKNLSRFHPADGSTVKRSLAPECNSGNPMGYFICGQVEPARSNLLAQEYITPYFSKALKKCLATERPIDEDKLATIHLRGEDVFGEVVNMTAVYAHKVARQPIHYRMVQQPFCYFYEKLISDSEWEHVLMLTTQDLRNPCVAYLNDRRSKIRNKNGQLLKWELQTSNIVSDACAVLKAKHLISSMSSFAHDLSMLGSTIGPKHVYSLTRGGWNNKWMLRCNTPNMTLHLFQNDAVQGYRGIWPNGTLAAATFPAIMEWLQTARNFSFLNDC